MLFGRALDRGADRCVNFLKCFTEIYRGKPANLDEFNYHLFGDFKDGVFGYGF
jgi:hypothetical protein